ncbi:MAG TPA: 5-(carboxyamino)imidazole ribonucleotide mutase [Vicinamibacteria bacterium]|nr:5-(carboxyamino)imidazole ribonucleotide mutase [Vicinamibacteria bacterium]
MAARPAIAVLMGSDSDLPVMAECVKVLASYGLDCDVRVLSAHRTPDAAIRYARRAEARGIRVFVCGAGGAAHLAGAIAAHATLPVIGVPLASSPLAGFDALLSTVQMPPGVPVATVGVGPMGAANAGHLAAQILAGGDVALRRKVAARRAGMAAAVIEKAKGLDAKLRELLKR